jgi:hypothetical protein
MRKTIGGRHVEDTLNHEVGRGDGKASLRWLRRSLLANSNHMLNSHGRNNDCRSNPFCPIHGRLSSAVAKGWLKKAVYVCINCYQHRLWSPATTVCDNKVSAAKLTTQMAVSKGLIAMVHNPNTDLEVYQEQPKEAMCHRNPNHMQVIKGYLFMQCHAVQCSMLENPTLNAQSLAIVLLFVSPPK